MFLHEEIGVLPELDVDTTDNGRFYTTPEGIAYPSVTTVLGRASDKTWIQEWKDRVGEAEARKVLAQAGRRGTAVHQICEDYLNNVQFYKKGHMPNNIASFNQIKPFLDENITVIGGLELPLYSHKLRVAGRVDGLVKWNGVWTILDFKTSRRQKERDSISGYFMQASCYSYMVFERLNILAPQIAIVMSVDDDEPGLFIERSKDWLPKFIEVRNSVDI